MDRAQSDEQRLLNLLDANVRAELRTRRRMLELVTQQERGVLDNRRDDVQSALRELETELVRAAAHAAARKRLLSDFGARWGVDPGVLTLGSVAERLGPRAANLAALRIELRELVAQLARRNRRLGALVSMLRRIVRDVVNTVLGDPSGDAFRTAGTVLSAEA